MLWLISLSPGLACMTFAGIVWSHRVSYSEQYVGNRVVNTFECLRLLKKEVILTNPTL